MDPHEVLDEMDRMLDTSGGEAPTEWDQYGNPIKYKTVIILKKLPVEKEPITSAGKVPKRRLYDVSSLRLENFHKVLHFISSNLKSVEPVFKQQIVDLRAMGSNLDDDDLNPYG